MADKASKALVFYGDGLARFLSPARTHLHSLASRASCSFLALPNSPPSENENMRMIREFAEIFDASEVYENTYMKRRCEDKPQEKGAFPTVSERFMGMKVAIVSDNLDLKLFGDKLGFKAFSWDEMTESSDLAADSSPLTPKFLELLGFEEGNVQETSRFELVFVHVGANTTVNGFKNIELINHLVGDLLHMVQFGSDIGSRLHLSVIMSYGATLGNDDSELSVSNTKHEIDDELSVLFPRQSYMMKAGKLRENVRQHCPMLLAQYQSAVTRMDMVKTFSFRDFKENGGNLVIPADRFLHEVAFKLWKAPKYGA